MEHQNRYISLKDKPAAERGMLSELSLVYDPLGLASPFILKGRRIIQKLYQGSKGWNNTVSDEMQKKWTKWRVKLPSLEKIAIQRCIKPADFGKVVESSVYHFSDGSRYGYGQVGYLRQCSTLCSTDWEIKSKPIKVCFHTKT